MKKIVYLIMILALSVSCKDKAADKSTDTDPEMEDAIDQTIADYPNDLVKIFNAHGGLDAWNEMETLEFSVEKPGGYEITTTDLKDRYAFIELPEHTIGFNGENLWVKNQNDRKFNGDPETYYNYMFHLYAMPFLLADEGLTFAPIEALAYAGNSYPGFHVTFNNHGTAAIQEANVYYDASTHRMTWLSYQENNNNNGDGKHFIHYSAWQEVEGILLPETMVWYASENNQPGNKKREVIVVSPMLTPVKMDMRVFAMPEEAEVVQ